MMEAPLPGKTAQMEMEAWLEPHATLEVERITIAGNPWFRTRQNDREVGGNGTLEGAKVMAGAIANVAARRR